MPVEGVQQYSHQLRHSDGPPLRLLLSIALSSELVKVSYQILTIVSTTFHRFVLMLLAHLSSILSSNLQSTASLNQS